MTTEISTKYKLEIIALSDGYKDYSEVHIKLNPDIIESIYPNPTTTQVVINYKINTGESAYVAISSLYASVNTVHNYILDIKKGEIAIDISDYPNGFYSVVLLSNGKITDTKTFIKQ